MEEGVDGAGARQNRKKGRGRRKRRMIPWIFLTPSLAGVAVFHGIPFLDVVRRSFQDVMGVRFLGLANYRAVWGNGAFRLAAVNTFRFLAVCIPTLLTVSLGLALLLTAVSRGTGRAPSRGDCGQKSQGFWHQKTTGQASCLGGNGRDGAVRTTMVLPMAVPAASMVLIWKIFLCPEGVLNQVLAAVTGEPWSVDWAFSGYAFPVLVLTYLWKHTGYDMILWAAGLAGIPEEYYEAARMDGAGVWARLRYITFPQLGGTFCLVGILSVVNSFRVYREAYLLAGSYPDSSIYLIPHLFAHWFLNLDVQKMTAAAVMMTAVFLAQASLLWLWGRRRRREGRGSV